MNTCYQKLSDGDSTIDSSEKSRILGQVKYFKELGEVRNKENFKPNKKSREGKYGD